VEQYLGQLLLGPALTQCHTQMQAQFGFATGGGVGDNADEGSGLQIEAWPVQRAPNTVSVATSMNFFMTGSL
jgi:hypothetical protein